MNAIPPPNSRARDFVEREVKKFLPDAQMHWSQPETLVIRAEDGQTNFTIGRAVLDDLEEALRGSQPVPYVNGLKADVHFNVAAALAHGGLLPSDFRFSSLLLSPAKLDWQSARLQYANFSKEYADGLYNGLKRLEESLELTLKSGLPLPEVQAELDAVRTMTHWYEENGNLNSPDVRTESLSYLRAAAVCWILDIEAKKTAEKIPRVKAVYDEKIFEIAAHFYSRPYNRIELPTALTDLIARETSSRESSTIASRQHIDVERLLSSIDPRLRNRWVGAWQVLRSDNPDRVSQALRRSAKSVRLYLG